MTNRSMIKTASTAIFLMLMFSVAAFAQKTDCFNTTDAAMVEAIYTKINAKYADQAEHINVRVENGTVTLEGWATTKKVKNEIKKFAKKTDCVKKVVNNLTIGIGGGCATGTKPCGDACIPTTSVCNIRTKGI